jgi:hypothetical protein
MTNWVIREIVNYLINKSQTGNTFGVDEFNTELNYASKKLFKRRLGMPEEYELNAPITKQSYALTSRILESLSHFVINDNLKFVGGVTAKPADLIYPLGMIENIASNASDCSVDIEPVLVELVDESEYMMRKTSSLTPINVFYPVYRILGDNLVISPKTITRTEYSYLRLPTDAVVAVTLEANYNEVYDAANSVELEWNDLDKLEIISIILGDVGLNLRSSDIMAASEQLKAKGI